jgi:hypothetical protein
MGQFRRLLESKCEAPGELISRGAADGQPADNPVKETLTGYQWKHGDTIVQLFYFAAEDTTKNQSFRSISVHYHYTDPYAVADATPEPTPSSGAGDVAAPAVGAAAAASAGGPVDPTHPAPGITVTPPRTNPKAGTKPTPLPSGDDPLPEH